VSLRNFFFDLSDFFLASQSDAISIVFIAEYQLVLRLSSRWGIMGEFQVPSKLIHNCLNEFALAIFKLCRILLYGSSTGLLLLILLVLLSGSGNQERLDICKSGIFGFLSDKMNGDHYFCIYFCFSKYIDDKNNGLHYFCQLHSIEYFLETVDKYFDFSVFLYTLMTKIMVCIIFVI
jgi:hypothetical protein